MKKAIPHPLKIADELSGNAWMKWAKKQQKK
jgi:Fe-S cluster biosynthesis and repair protein YggX